MPKISLIIPVYNVEKYIDSCLQSCINQTLKDIEIICIDDFSTDSSLKIIKNFADNDNRICIINHESNLKLGAARNSGVNIAKGKYIWFIDSDDIIPLDSCEILYNSMTNNDVDIIRFNMLNFINNDLSRLGRFERIDKNYWPYNRIIEKHEHNYLNNTNVTACSFITKSSLIKQFKFRENIFHEDLDYTPILFSKAERILCLDMALYYRRLHSESITGGGINFVERTKNIFLAIESLKKYIEMNDLNKNHFCNKILMNSTKQLYYDIKNNSEKINNDINEIYIKLRKYKKKSYNNFDLLEDITLNYSYNFILVFLLRVYRFFYKHYFLLILKQG